MCLACEMDALWFAEMEAAVRASSPLPARERSSASVSETAGEGLLGLQRVREPLTRIPSLRSGIRPLPLRGEVNADARDDIADNAGYAICSASRRLSMSDARSRNARARTGSSAVRRNSS